MVGRSSRFFNAGYVLPKHQLKINKKSVFSHAICSFEQYFESDSFLFIVRSDYDTPRFVERELDKLGIKNFQIKVFEQDTMGQAETVYLGLKGIDVTEPIIIFNIDTFRPHFKKSEFTGICDGYLEVFKGEGEHWSFVEAGHDKKVIRTTEKERISDLCSDGLYYFKKKLWFDQAFEFACKYNDTVNGEFYIAPLYNHLIASGLDVRFHMIRSDEVVFCGVPAEYELLNTKAG